MADSKTPKKKTRPEMFKPQQVIDALTAARGMRSLAARALGCTYRTVQRYINEYPEVAQAEVDAHEFMLDTIELKAYDRAMKDDTTMIIFLLKTQGKKRGYVERQEHIIEEGKIIPILKTGMDLDKI